ncbi:hypothetical protein LCGC14_0519210 [marine sediment metagenome]|uniref:C2H2-type domain-containing protein n=1 Tax=marine sediment metagenome TaxID=412755 RepID=A0A0F9RZ34_9ZZZZ
MATRKRKAAKTRRRQPVRRRKAAPTRAPVPVPVPEMTDDAAQAIGRQIAGPEPGGSGPEREAPQTNIDYWATRPMGYGNVDLDRGQVFRLVGLRNDKLLVDLDYCQPVRTSDRYPCRACGAAFMDLGSLEGHGRRRHEPARVGPPPPMRMGDETEVAYQARLDQWAIQAGAATDAQIEREDTQADAVHPLNLENTAASRSA